MIAKIIITVKTVIAIIVSINYILVYLFKFITSSMVDPTQHFPVPPNPMLASHKLKKSSGQNKQYNKCPLFSFASSNSSILLLICDSYMR